MFVDDRQLKLVNELFLKGQLVAQSMHQEL